MKKFIKKYFLLIFIFFLIPLSLQSIEAEAAKKPVYTITPQSKPYKNKFTNLGTYNKNTKQYYLIRSYLEQLQKTGGGTLVLKSGTYNITNTLFVPSNVTIRFKDGVVINKRTKTGTSGLKATGSLFQCVAPSKAGKKGCMKQYNGMKNISFIGEGTVIIDLQYTKDCVGIIVAHNQNVNIKNITFQNMKGGHFLEIDASKNVRIVNNTFKNHKASAKGNKEAINLDTPDKNTNGLNVDWTSYDCTPNKNVLIQGNTFLSLERAIGTHKYSQGRLHKNIKILDNIINYCDQDPIRIMNWDSPVITGNYISNVDYGNGTYRAILASGVHNPTIQNNVFENVARPIQIMAWKNTGAGEEYDIIYSTLSEENIAAMQQNTLVNVGETFIRYNTEYNNYKRVETYPIFGY